MGIWEWSIHGLNGWGNYDLNGWGIYGSNGWVSSGKGRGDRKMRQIPFPVIAWPSVFGPFELTTHGLISVFGIPLKTSHLLMNFYHPSCFQWPSIYGGWLVPKPPLRLHLDGEPWKQSSHFSGQLYYPNVNTVIWMVNFYIQMDAAIWMINFYSLLWGCSFVPRLIRIPLTVSLGTRSCQRSDWCARMLHRIVSDLATYVDEKINWTGC